ncbi:hypothetical protein B0T13DRAFT_124045 [Neurospora crassa]|nr:hypothetical protein B0T13DRAFT_124045 [Neurospora crassa]
MAFWMRRQPCRFKDLATEAFTYIFLLGTIALEDHSGVESGVRHRFRHLISIDTRPRSGMSLRKTLKVLVGAAKDPKRFHKTFDGRLFCRSRDQIGWINRFPWGLGRNFGSFGKVKASPSWSLPPLRKGKNHSQIGGAGVPIRMEHAQNNRTQSWPMLCNRLKTIHWR